jgi:hypothetical protein
MAPNFISVVALKRAAWSFLAACKPDYWMLDVFVQFSTVLSHFYVLFVSFKVARRLGHGEDEQKRRCQTTTVISAVVAECGHGQHVWPHVLHVVPPKATPISETALASTIGQDDDSHEDNEDTDGTDSFSVSNTPVASSESLDPWEQDVARVGNRGRSQRSPS